MPKQSFAVTPVKGQRDIGLVVDDIADVDHLGGVKNCEYAFGIMRGAMVAVFNPRPRERRIGF